MDISKKNVQQALTTITLPGDGKHLMESGAVKNILVFGEEVVIDITVQNPSLHRRYRQRHTALSRDARVAGRISHLVPWPASSMP